MWFKTLCVPFCSLRGVNVLLSPLGSTIEAAALAFCESIYHLPLLSSSYEIISPLSAALY
eukprot:COSAG02_NODE_1982_length_10196_cov_6.214816_8_plen_60_part_00